MDRLLRRHLRRTNLKRFVAVAALLAFYGWWTFAETSPWTRPYAALGGEMPELIAGFPAGEPAAAIAIGLKAVRIAAGDARALLLAPAIFFVGELAENGLLALFAGGVADPDGALASAQQIAAVGKFTAMVLTVLLAAASLGVAGATALMKVSKRAA